VTKRASALLLILVLLLGLGGTSAALASEPAHHPFGEDAVPLTLEELEEVEGAWAAQTIVGAAVGGITYLITTPSSSWNVGDCLRHMAAGAVSGLLGSFF
jgi:D-tyrosyl-tRNA(Tyr) deacylase